MVKSRSEQQRFTKMTRLGVANQDLLGKARLWCKHLSVEMRSAGMIAEVTGLPVGSHEIRCPHATGGTAGMNLPWLLPQFVIEHCRGCPHHLPVGDVTWGQEIFRDADARAAAKAQAKDRLAELRLRMLSLPRVARGTADLSEYAILEWIELLFGEDAHSARESERRLGEAAQVAPELFRDAAVNALVEGAAVEPFGARCLPVLANLSAHRPDLDERLKEVAQIALIEGHDLQPQCQILFEIFHRTEREVDPVLVSRVVSGLNYIRPIGGWKTKDPECHLIDIDPDYSASTRLLILAFDRQPESIITPLQEAFADNAKIRRINACGIVKSLNIYRSKIGIILLHNILRSLELDDDMFDDSADGAACSLLAKLFRQEPAIVDDLLSTQLLYQSEEVQSLYIDVYQSVTRRRWREPDAAPINTEREREVVARGFQRCLQFLQEDRLGLTARRYVPQTIKSVCEDHPEIALTAFDALLGTIAILHTRANPPEPPPSLHMLGELEPSAGLVALNNRNRLQQWNLFKDALREALEELVSNRPGQTLPTLLSSFDSVCSKTSPGFKADLVTLIGRIGCHPEFRPVVMPALWKALMDFDAQRVRSNAVMALSEAFRDSHAPPPSDVVDALLIHLRDTYVIVHLAAARTLGSNANWLSEQQAMEALTLLYTWAKIYKRDDPFNLEPIVDALLLISRRFPAIRKSVVDATVSLLPINEQHIDSNLRQLLARRITPNDPEAVSIAGSVAQWVAMDRGDSFDYYENEQQVERFMWLYGLTKTAFDHIEKLIADIARGVASRDPRTGCLFASLFGACGHYGTEAELLGLVDSNLPAGRQNERLKSAVASIRTRAEQNSVRVFY